MENNGPRTDTVNNGFYDALGERWYDDSAHPVTLLRAEAKLKNPWVRGVISRRLGRQGVRVLDVGCGAGFLANDLARSGHRVTGVDQSAESLATAHRHDRTGSVVYEQTDVSHLPYRDGEFDVVCAMDFLEHVEDARGVIAECSRVIRPGGLFLIHTFSRNFWSWLVIIKGVEWFVPNVPPNLHVHRLFLDPEEAVNFCRACGLSLLETTGVRPAFGSWGLWRMLLTRRVSDDFKFVLTPSLRIGYMAVYEKRGRQDR